MNTKKIMAIATAAVMLTSFTACNSNSESSTAQNNIVTNGPSVLSAGTAEDTVIVKFEGNEELNITFGDFIKEYKYYLASYGITDDTAAEYADTLTSRREYIANYLINSTIIYKKFDELGLTLTDEENAQIDADTAAGVESMKQVFKDRVSAGLAEGETLSDEELTKRAEAEYQNMLQYCGLTEEDFRNWQKEIIVQKRLVEHTNKDFSLDYSEAEKQIENYIAESKANYEKDSSTYKSQAMGDLWIPDGSKEVKHILVQFDADTIKQITGMRSNGDNDGADTLRTKKADEMSDEIKVISDKIAAGEDFDSLILEYSDDGDGITSYIVAPGTADYMPEFTECALGIAETGSVDTCVTDYGYHFVKYEAVPVVTDEDIKQQTDRVYDYLCEANKTNKFNEYMAQWRAEYTIEIDRDVLMLAEEEASAT